jgi:thymidylate kinase
MLLLIDGIDGAGKSTLLEALLDLILEVDHDYHDGFKHVVNTFQFPSRMPQGPEKADAFSRTMFHLNDFFETMRDHKGFDDIRICDRSFITTMAYQGFNEKAGEALLSHRFESIMTLGAEAMLTTRNPSDMESTKDVFFLHVKCDPEEAAKRILSRSTDRVGEIEQESNPEALRERLATLQDRLNLCYAETRMRIDPLLPQHNYFFLEVDSTETGTKEMAEQVMDLIKPIKWPQQTSIF